VLDLDRFNLSGERSLSAVHFLCLTLSPSRGTEKSALQGAKENEPKERAPGHLSACGGYPALLEVAGSLKTREVYNPLRGAQTVQTPFSATSAVLSCVTMGKSNAHLRRRFTPFQGLPEASSCAGGVHSFGHPAAGRFLSVGFNIKGKYPRFLGALYGKNGSY
jgi:hypothetical protein